MDSPAISRILLEIADLLEIEGDNPFKIRAYRNGADIAANQLHHLPSLDEAGLGEIPGIGKNLAARIGEIGNAGGAVFHRELPSEFPQSNRLDSSEVHLRLARDRGARLVISSDAHSGTAVGALRWGVLVARRAWLEPIGVLNRRAFDVFRGSLRRNRL